MLSKDKNQRKILQRRLYRGLFHALSLIVKVKFKTNLKDVKDIRNIIVFRTDNLGDFVMSIPIVNSIKQKYPYAKITCVVHPESSSIARKICEEVIEYSSPYLHSKHLTDDINIKNIVNIVNYINNKQNYDLIVDFKSDLMTILFAIKSKAKYRLDISSHRILNTMKKTVNILIKKNIFKLEKTHEIDFMAKILEKSGIEVNKFYDICSTLNEEEVKIPFRILPKNFLDKKIAILHPGASWKYKRWNYLNFAKVANYLIDNKDFNVILVGSSNEHELAENIKQLIKDKNKIMNLCGKTSIVDLISIIRIASLVICNDSAIGHIAAMCSANTISLFGAQDPSIFGPVGPNVRIIKKEINCSPCSQVQCVKPEGERCMDLIKPEDVIKIIENTIGINEKTR